MMTREEIDNLKKSVPPGMPCGLVAEASEDKSILAINIFTFDGQQLTLAELLASLLAYQGSMIEGKMIHGFTIPWHPGERKQTPPPVGNPGEPVHKRATYLGEDLP